MRTFRGVSRLGAQGAGASAAQTNRWAEAKCDIKPGHYLVNSGLLYLKSATESRFAEQKQKDLRDAQRVLTQALTSGSQEKNPAAWYYLGRYYILTNDAVGADSAFARAETLKPDCKGDIDLWRRFVWAPTFNAGVAAWQANNTDSAIASFKRASALLPNDPTAPKYIATLYYNAGQSDSAMAYFRRAADVAARDPKLAQDRKDALYNLGRIQQSQQHLPEAEATYREYLALYPNDADILAPLGSLLMQRGSKDSAFAIYKQIISRGDSMGYIPLHGRRRGPQSRGRTRENSSALRLRQQGDDAGARRQFARILSARRAGSRCESQAQSVLSGNADLPNQCRVGAARLRFGAVTGAAAARGRPDESYVDSHDGLCPAREWQDRFDGALSATRRLDTGGRCHHHAVRFDRHRQRGEGERQESAYDGECAVQARLRVCEPEGRRRRDGDGKRPRDSARSEL